MLDQFLAKVGTSSRNLARLAIADEEHPVGGQLMGATQMTLHQPPADLLKLALTVSTSTLDALSKKSSVAAAVASS